MVIQAGGERVHEMLCRAFPHRFDNRMLQKKKQLRGVARGFRTAFPLLYSEFVRDEINGHLQREGPMAGNETPGRVRESNVTIARKLLNP